MAQGSTAQSALVGLKHADCGLAAVPSANVKLDGASWQTPPQLGSTGKLLGGVIFNWELAPVICHLRHRGPGDGVPSTAAFLIKVCLWCLVWPRVASVTKVVPTPTAGGVLPSTTSEIVGSDHVSPNAAASVPMALVLVEQASRAHAPQGS